MGLWCAPRREFCRIRTLRGVLGLGVFLPVSPGCSTLLWSPMYAAAGPPRWSPGAACWRETFGIHWWDAMCLRVVFGGRLWSRLKIRVVYSLLARLSSAAAIFGSNSGSFWGRARSLLICRTACSLRFFSRLRFCFSWSFCGPCCARSGRQRSHGFFSSRSSSHGSIFIPLPWGRSDRDGCDCVTAETPRLAVAGGCIRLRQSPGTSP